MSLLKRLRKLESLMPTRITNRYKKQLQEEIKSESDRRKLRDKKSLLNMTKSFDEKYKVFFQ